MNRTAKTFTTGRGQTARKFKNKRVLIMGLGLIGGGTATAKFLAKKGAKITITDLRSPSELKPALRTLKNIKNVRYVLGQHYQNDFINSDLIVKNPGVKPNSPFLKIAQKHHVPITSDMGIFFNNCPGRIIGVTGTRGKSTTAYLIWRLLKEKYKGRKSLKFFLGGNIGKPVLEFLPLVKKGDWAVLELSSFQLHDLALEKQSPEIAVITNIFPDHLNWHKNFASYLESKTDIFSFQDKKGFLFIDGDNKILRQAAQKAKSKIITSPRLPKNLEKIVTENLGPHYKNAVALALAVAKHFGVGDKKIAKVLKNFRGLEGREQIIRNAKGVTWINDTTSTMPEATLAALYRFRNMASKAGGRLILIAGGQDKKLKFDAMALTIKKTVAVLILLPGTATEKLKKLLRITNQNELRIIEIKSMSGAVKKAAKSAGDGDVVVLSPGAASFGLFQNEFDRGKQFTDFVHRLT